MDLFTSDQEKRFLRGILVTVPEDSPARIFRHARRAPLRIKYGIDPTQSDLHLGHFAILRKLRLLQECGHTIVVLFGDFTARFGDPTGKMGPRSLREKTEVNTAMRTYKEQIATVLDRTATEFRRNSEWYEHMTAEELLRLLSGFTVQQMLERDMFARRRKHGAPIGLHEPTYPVLQGYDSATLKIDATVIGKDQLFNEMIGRHIQERLGQTPQTIFGVDLLVGTDGKEKMSQSLGNHIQLVASAEEQYGKIMAIPDDAILTYAELLTEIPLRQLATTIKKRGKNARDAKARIARDIVNQLHGESAARRAEAAYVSLFREKTIPKNIPRYTVKSNATITATLRELGIVKSNTHARQLAQQGGIRIDGQIVVDPASVLRIGEKGAILSVGKRIFVRLMDRREE